MRSTRGAALGTGESLMLLDQEAVVRGEGFLSNRMSGAMESIYV